MRSLFEGLVGPDYALLVMWIVAGLVVLILLFALVRLLRGVNGGTFVAGGRNRRARLAVMDAAAVDSRRRLVLIRRDDVEHLLLIGGPTDVVVEQDIRLSRPQKPAQPEGPAIGPAMAVAPAPEPAPEPAREPIQPQTITAPPAPPPAPARPPEPAPAVRPAPPSRDAGFYARPARSTAAPVPPAAAAMAAIATPPSVSAQEIGRTRPGPEFTPAGARPAPEPVAPAPRAAEPPVPEPRPEPRFEPQPQPQPPPPVRQAYAPAPPVESQPPVSAATSRANDVDDDLLRELEVTLERAEQRRPEPQSEDAMLEDEMSKLLGELSGERR